MKNLKSFVNTKKYIKEAKNKEEYTDNDIIAIAMCWATRHDKQVFEPLYKKGLLKEDEVDNAWYEIWHDASDTIKEYMFHFLDGPEPVR